MSRSKWVVGGVLALGLVGLTAPTASAQFVYGGVPAYRGTYVTPYGGVVNKTVSYSPFTGNTFVNKTYVNPYTGAAFGRQYVSPGFGGPVWGGPVYGGPVWGNPGFVSPGYGWGRPGFGGPAFVGPGFGGFGPRGGISIGIGFGRGFW